jgi:hypothetical protein
MPASRDTAYVLDKMNWMRAERMWPNGLRYLWTDAFGVVLLVSEVQSFVRSRSKIC